jgi:outer membrane murein-binding lipoprotein Lpp
LDDVTEDQFTLAACVACVNQGIDILPLRELAQELEAIAAAVDELEKRLSSVRAAINAAEEDAVRAFFTGGANWSARAAVTV